MTTSQLTPEAIADAQRVYQELIERAKGGESTGNPIVDFLVTQTGAYDAKLVARWHELQEQFAAHQGELVLFSHNWEDRYVSAHGVSQHEYSYAFEQIIWIGLLEGPSWDFKVSQANGLYETLLPHVPTSQYAVYTSCRGSMLAPADPRKFEFTDGGFALHPLPIHHDHESTNPWDWRLDLKEQIDIQGTGHMGSAGRWLDIRVGNDAVGEWLDGQGGADAVVTRGLGSQLDDILKKFKFPVNAEVQKLLAYGRN
jgi:hypothetical protein